MKKTLSVCLATRNEENNIGRCLASVKHIASEIIVFDESSHDKTRSIARSFGAKVFKVKHNQNFHKTKLKAINKAQGDYILLLDADESISEDLSKEIESVLNGKVVEIKIENQKIFQRHQNIISKRDNTIFTNSDFPDAYFIPRLNFFLDNPLFYGGVYPDGVIRLFKKNKATLPADNVHEQIMLLNKSTVGWLNGPLEHRDSPKISRYIDRLNRYTDLNIGTMKKNKEEKGYTTLLKYTFFLPGYYFFIRYIRHKGYKDGLRGFLWALFSSWHYPIAYFKYYTE